MATRADARMHESLTRFAALAIGAALVTMGLKFAAYTLTGSVGLLSDAVESTANLVAALTALFAVWFAARPIDRSHNYGHEKIEYFAAAIEGLLILVAAGAIVWAAIDRWNAPRPLEGLGAGLAVSIAATLVNLFVGRRLIAIGRRAGSIALEADGRHLMTDVLTSVGVVVGLALVAITGVDRLDPVIAGLVAINIGWTGISLLRDAFDGLMDRALPVADELVVREAIARELRSGETYHALRTRQSGSRQFVDFHLLVPGTLTVSRAHEITHRLEAAVEAALPRAEATVHIEPVEDPRSWADSELVTIEVEKQLTPQPPAGAPGV